MPTQKHLAEAAEMLARAKEYEEKAERGRKEFLDQFETVYDGKGWTTKHKVTGLGMQAHAVWMEEQRKITSE